MPQVDAFEVRSVVTAMMIERAGDRRPLRELLAPHWNAEEDRVLGLRQGCVLEGADKLLQVVAGFSVLEADVSFLGPIVEAVVDATRKRPESLSQKRQNPDWILGAGK